MKAMSQNKQLQNHFDCHRLTLREEIEHKLVSYLALKSKEFYKDDICKFAVRWN